MTDVEERFWAKVDRRDDDQCWDNGYGAFNFKGTNHYAHRLVIYFTQGHMPPEDKEVCHICDNPACVNPNHLMIATHAENMFDASVKGRLRGPRELDNPQGKLTDEDVCELRREFIETDTTRSELSQKYNISESYVKALLGHDKRDDIDGSPPPVRMSDVIEKHKGQMLTEHDVIEIRRRYKANPSISYPELAEDYPVTSGCIGKIIRRENWQHLDEVED